MSKNRILTAVIVLFLVAIVWIIMQATGSKSVSLVSPGIGKGVGSVESQSTPQPTVSSFNAPKEIKYDSSTDLQKELDSINPQVLDSDFDE